jgi:hypothetical protein
MALQQDVADRIAALKLPKGFAVCELGSQGLCGDVKDQPTKPWYESIGCERYESIDGNGRGTLTFDLNNTIHDDVHRPRTALTRGSFDLVTDLGTGEHIFDQASVWRSMHWLVKAGGYIAIERPTTAYPKHCFYLVNECLLRDVAAANQYDVVWFHRKPMERGELVRCIFRTPTTARFFRVPQQGKYHPDLVIPR